MPTPTEIVSMAASLMNDTAQQNYTNAAVLPYLNMALNELQELFELNNIPTTNETSSVLSVPIATVIIGANTIPALPSQLIDIQQLWESPSGQNRWIPMTRREFLSHYFDDTDRTQFSIFAWMNQEIRLLAAISVIDLKIDYIQSIFATPILIGQVGNDLGIKNSLSFLGYRTAALCAEFIGENPTRAASLNSDASIALDRTLGISTKGRQATTTRRRPFQSSYRTRGY